LEIETTLYFSSLGSDDIKFILGTFVKREGEKLTFLSIHPLWIAMLLGHLACALDPMHANKAPIF